MLHLTEAVENSLQLEKLSFLIRVLHVVESPDSVSLSFTSREPVMTFLCSQ
jgi:hypothetical protein